VIVPAVSAKGFSTSAAAQYVATFKDVLVSSPVVTRWLRRTTSDQRLGERAQRHDGHRVEQHHPHHLHRFEGQNTTGIVDDASILTLDTVAEPELVQARTPSAPRRCSFNRPTRRSTTSTPQRQHPAAAAVHQPAAGAGHALARAAAGEPRRRHHHATALQSIITQREQQLATLAGQVNQYTALSDARQAAISVSDHAARSSTMSSR